VRRGARSTEGERDAGETERTERGEREREMRREALVHTRTHLTLDRQSAGFFAETREFEFYEAPR